MVGKRPQYLVRTHFSTGRRYCGNRRQAGLRHHPGIAAILGDPQPAAGRAKGETLAALIDRERMAPYQVIGVLLRQTVPQHLEAAAAVAGAGDDDLAVDRDAPLVLDRRDEPRGVRIPRMGGDGKAELRRTDRRQLVPGGAGILRTKDAVVVLAPDDFGIGGAARQPVNVLGDRLLALLR